MSVARRDAARSRARSQPPSVDVVATIAHRLAVLLGAGVTPATAWLHAGGAAAPQWVAEIAAGAARDPASIPDAIAAAGRRAGRGGAPVSPLAGLSALWRVAAESGAPLSPALRAVASSLRSAAESTRVANTAFAGPRATARLVVAMPAVAVVFGALLGYNTVGVLLGTPIGWACVTVGVTLMLVARWWSRRLVAKASEADPYPGMALDLLAVAMAGGGAIVPARALVDAALRKAGLSGSTADAVLIIEIAVAVGAPVGELLRAEAEEVRREAAAVAATKAATLESSLMIPLGVCVLPAFVALGVVPLLVAVLSSTVAIL